MTTPTLSVVLPVYNGGKYVAEALESVLAEKDIEMEVVVGDHSSTDDTREVVARFETDPRVRVITIPSGGFVKRAWNAVSDEATGRYLKLVCADDVVYPGILRRQVELLEARPDAVLTACPRDVTDAAGKILIKDMGLQGVKREMPGPAAVRKVVRAGRNIFGEPGCVTMRRDAFVRAGGWFADFPYLIDMATYSRVLLQGDFVPDLETGATFRLNADQHSVAQANSQSQQAIGFHHWMHQHAPDVVRESDLRVGNVRARLNAHLRRLTFSLLRQRMS